MKSKNYNKVFDLFSIGFEDSFHKGVKSIWEKYAGDKNSLEYPEYKYYSQDISDLIRNILFNNAIALNLKNVNLSSEYHVSIENIYFVAFTGNDTNFEFLNAIPDILLEKAINKNCNTENSKIEKLAVFVRCKDGHFDYRKTISVPKEIQSILDFCFSEADQAA